MHGEAVQDVLRCGQCNKPFDKPSTLKRHGYYCRSRRTGSTPRTRSCISCARRKARCDNGRPACSRCTTKAIECHYPPNRGKVTVSRTQPSNDAPTGRQKLVTSFVVDPPNVDNLQEASTIDDISLDTALGISDFDFANLEEQHLDWNGPEADLVDLLNPQTNHGASQDSPPESSSLVRRATPSTDRTIRGQQAAVSPSITRPALSTYTLRSLIQRPKARIGAQRVANLMLHTLKSYPRMMLRHNTLPPFIHPQLISSDVGVNHMEPMNNCISLVHMISTGIQGSRKLFWKNVRLECERLREEHQKLNKWELLAAMQALSIYILIRLDEGETEHNNFDFLILGAVAVIAKQLGRSHPTCNTLSALYNYDLEAGWKDWVFEESRRRLLVVYRVVDMLVYFEPAAMCDLQTDLALAPLPAKKQLWEAGDGSAWKTESEREPGIQNTFALTANGELARLDESQLYCGNPTLLYNSLDSGTLSSSNTHWEEWCSGMDGFGGLVMLAASLIG